MRRRRWRRRRRTRRSKLLHNNLLTEMCSLDKLDKVRSNSNNLSIFGYFFGVDIFN